MPVQFKKCNSCRTALPAHWFELGSFVCKNCKKKVEKKDMQGEKTDGKSK